MKSGTMGLVKMCFFVGSFSAVQLATVVEAKPFETLENLSKAYVVEADAFNKYGLYAAQADKDGYPMVARLFRAAALSEIIHSRNHSAEIDSLGGKLMKFELKQVKVGTTHENLESAAKDERLDELAMYGKFIDQAGRDGLRDAKASFQFASNSEIQHKQLFAKGLSVLGPKNADYYVDVRSGETVEVLSGQKPPKSDLVNGAYVKAGY